MVEIFTKKNQLKIFYFLLVIFLFVSIFVNNQNAPIYSSSSETTGVLNPNVVNIGGFSLCLKNSISQLANFQVNQVTKILTDMGYRINLDPHFGMPTDKNRREFFSVERRLCGPGSLGKAARGV